jgi:hypothetical protein
MWKPNRVALTRIAVVVMSLGGICACATGSTAHWEKPGGEEHAFQADNERCGEVASRVGSGCTATPSSCGTSAPPNRIDRPPHVDANGMWQRAYMDCMSTHGWRVVQQ